jgi:hypothetical protein
MPYTIMPKNMCQNTKYNTRYDSMSIALTYMSVATLYDGHLRMVKLLECYIISYQTMASRYRMLVVSHFTVLLRVEVRRELEFAYDRGRLLVFGIREVSTPVGLPC